MNTENKIKNLQFNAKSGLNNKTSIKIRKIKDMSCENFKSNRTMTTERHEITTRKVRPDNTAIVIL